MKKKSSRKSTVRAASSQGKRGGQEVAAKTVISEPVKKETPRISSSDFYIVGIGASAGGLEAFEQFFAHMPPDSGMAFVLIPHLSPEHKSLMADLLNPKCANSTRLYF